MKFKMILICILVLTVPQWSHADKSIKPETKKIRLTAEQEEWIKTHPGIRLGLFEGIEPVMFAGDDGEFQGIVKELIDIVGERAGIRFEVVPIHPEMRNKVSDLVKEGKIDLFPGFETPERRQYLNFTDPIYTVKWVIIARNDTPIISGLRDVKSLNLKLVCINSMKWHKRLSEDYPDIHSIQVDTVLEALELVSYGKADAVVTGLEASAYLIRKYGLHNLKIAAPAERPDSLARLAVRKDRPELLEILNKTINSIDRKKSDEVIQKWLPIHLDPLMDWSFIIKWGLAIGSVFTIILGISLFWNRRLASEIVERKQAEEALRIKDRAIETSINAIAISDLEGKITYVNPAFLNIWGYDDIEDILGKTVLEFWRIPEKADEVVGKLQNTGSWTQ